MAQQPDIKAYSLQEFFSSSYKVPTYQRNYAWGDTHVKQLVEDLLEFNSSRDAFYLLGDTIVAETKDSKYKFELIDGQQRTTTLQILFSVIWVKLKEAGQDEDATNALYTATRISKDLLKVKASGSASKTITDYLKSFKLEGLQAESPSQKNVIAAIDTIEARLAAEFRPNDIAKLIKFKDRLLEDCYLGRLTLSSVNQAAEIFEKTNNRGVRLSNSDLLKNRLFQNLTKETDYDDASQMWSLAENNLSGNGKYGTVEFLIRQIRQSELGEKITERSLFEKTKKVVSNEASCKAFIALIDSKQRDLTQILRGCTPSGSLDDFSATSEFFGFSQAYGVRLAASGLDEDSYLLVSRRLEARIALSLLSNERSQVFEKTVPVWQKNLAKLKGSVSKIDVIKATPIDSNALADLFTISELLVKELTYGASPGGQKRIRYVLGSVNAHLNRLGGQHSNEKLVDFLSTTKRKGQNVTNPGYDIDHISARTSSALAKPDLLGNLTLLYFKDNQWKSDQRPLDAKVVYGHSVAYATRALTSTIQQPPEIEKILSGLRVATIDDGLDWSEHKVALRRDFYWDTLKSRLQAALNLA